MPHATGSIKCILLMQRQLKRTFAENVSQLLPCIIGHFQAGTRVSSVVAYSGFNSKFPDYVLNKAGLFSTKLSQNILCNFTRHTQSHHFLVASLVTTRCYLHMRIRVKDCATIVHNLRILRIRNGILRLHKFSDCAEQ